MQKRHKHRSSTKRARTSGYIPKIAMCVLLLVVAIFLLLSVTRLYGKYRTADTQRDESTSALRRLQEQEQRLSQDLEYIKTSTGVETIIRDTYRVTKEGEHLLILTDEDEFRISQDAISNEKSRKGLFKKRNNN